MALKNFIPTADICGWIGYDLLDYDIVAGGDLVIFGFNGLAGYYISRGYLSFDVSGLPLNAGITQVRLRLVYFAKAPSGPGLPSSWVHNFYMGANVIPPTLDITDWGGMGTKAVATENPVEGEMWIILSSDTYPIIYQRTTADIEIRDSSLAMGSGGWSIGIYGGSSGVRYPILEVTYTLPTIRNAKIYNARLINA